MSKKQIAIGTTLIGLSALVVVFVLAGGVLAQGPALPPGEYDLEAGQYTINQHPDSLLSLSVMTITPTGVLPTDTPVPPTDTPIPPPTDPPSVHDDRTWHPVSADVSHEHGENPHSMDGVFGIDYYAWAGGEISYPWQTPNENLNKHEGYKWATGKNLSCDVRGDGCITDFRTQFHAIMSYVGAPTRIHSFWVEARYCSPDNSDPANCGIVRTGGWQDFGILQVDGVYIPVPSDPSPPFQNASGARRSHDGPGGGGFVVWYTSLDPGKAQNNHWLAGVEIETRDAFGPIDPADPFNPLFFCPLFDCEFNNSTHAIHSVIVFGPPHLDTDGDGFLDFDGYSEETGGAQVASCADLPGICVPLKWEHAPLGYVQYRNFDRFEYDISPPGEFWIEHPN